MNTSMPQGDGTNSGNGNAVSVTNSGVIATSGLGAIGIVAQSIGGGGGLNVANGNAGSAGGNGSGGNVTVTNNGSINTVGNYAYGIFAQSAGGKGSGGDININLAGSVTVQGLGSNGIYAQSTGAAGNGNISVTIAPNGGVYCLSDSSTAVSFVGGKDNVLNTFGTIESAGQAVSSTDGTNTIINNFGSMFCSVQLGQGTNIFNNIGTFWSGAVVNLGAGNNLLIDSGNLEIGGPGVVATTALTGNFVQTGSGIFYADIDYLTRTADELFVSGTAKVDGKVGLNLLNPGFIKPGSQQDTILSAAGGTDFTGSSQVYNSAVMQSQLFVLNATDLVLSTNVNFNPSGLTKNQSIMGDYINRLLIAGGGNWLDSLLAYHLGIANSQSLGAAYDTLLPYTNEADTLTTIQINRQYLRTFQNRMEWLRPGSWEPTDTAMSLQAKPILLAYDGPDSQLGQFLAPAEPASANKKAGFWFNGFSQFGNSNADGFTGFNYIMAGGCAGIDYAFTDRFVAGVGGGSANTNLNLEGDWGHSNFNSYFATLYGTYFTDKAYLEGVLSYGLHQYYDNHLIDLGTSQLEGSSSHEGDSFSSVFEGGYTFRPKGFVIQPFTALSYIDLSEGSYQETGLGGLGLQVGSRQSNDLSSEVERA